MTSNSDESQDFGFQQPPTGQPFLSASDADREATLAIIDRGLVQGRLTPAEHAERTALAAQARSLPDLDALSRDLVVIRDSHHADDLVPRPDGPALPVTFANSIGAYLGDKKRSGAWLVPSQLSLTAVLGSIKLDMREASFESLDITIPVSCFMGEVQIFVPEGTTVLDNTHTVLGDVTLKKLSPPRVDAPRVVLTGTVIMGEVTVYGSEHVSLLDRIKGNF